MERKLTSNEILLILKAVALLLGLTLSQPDIHVHGQVAGLVFDAKF